MAVEGVLTIEEQRALVYEYLALPHGAKAPFLRGRGVTSHVFYRWRSQVLADTLEQGLVPRSGGLVSTEEAGALGRLAAENQVLREQVAARETAHEQALAALELELERRGRAVDALGKAIEILHRSGASKNSTHDPHADTPSHPSNPSTPSYPSNPSA